MTLEIKTADRTDLGELLSFMYEERPIIDKGLYDFYDGILSQTGYSLLLAKQSGKIVGTLGISIINGIGENYPLAVLSGGKLSDETCPAAVGKMLVNRAKEIAARFGCGCGFAEIVAGGQS